MVTARVIGTTDSGAADRFLDEHGYEWVYAVDAIDGTIAVEREDGAAAGVFTWVGEEGRIERKDEGDTYGVNRTDEFIVRDGEWVETEP